MYYSSNMSAVLRLYQLLLIQNKFLLTTNTASHDLSWIDSNRHDQIHSITGSLSSADSLSDIRLLFQYLEKFTRDSPKTKTMLMLLHMQTEVTNIQSFNEILKTSSIDFLSAIYIKHKILRILIQSIQHK